MTTMLALHWDGESLSCRQKPLPEPGVNESLIKVIQAGICNTDLEITRGYAGFYGTPGHEFIGRVIKSNNAGLLEQRVVCDINFSCGQCLMCKAGQAHHCLQRHTLGIRQQDGCFAEFLCAPTDNLVTVPDSISSERASFAEPLAAALEIAEQVDLSGIREAAVIGDGKLGLLIAMVLCQLGIEVSLVGHHPENYQLIKRPGINFSTTLPDRDFALVVEASGNPAGFRDALSITRARGFLVLKSTYPEQVGVDLSSLVVNEITLLGSRCGPMHKAVALLETGEVNPEVLIEARYSLAEACTAFEHARRKGAKKILVNCSSD